MNDHDVSGDIQDRGRLFPRDSLNPQGISEVPMDMEGHANKT